MPLSLTPRCSRNSVASASVRSTRSLSICALITTSSQPRCVPTYSSTCFTYGFECAFARSSSRTLQAKIVFLSESRKNAAAIARSSGVRPPTMAGLPAANGLQVREHQLGVDHLDVAHRVDRARDVMDVGILEAAHHLDDRVHLADVGEELVSQPLTLARALHQPGDVHELDRR